jgi:hypothetical protein
MKSVSTILILAVTLLFSCTNQEEVSPTASALENDKTLLAVIETAQGHRISFHEYAPGSVGTLAAYPAGEHDEFSMEIQALMGSRLTATSVYKQLAKNNINKQYLQNLEGAVARLVELRSKQKNPEVQPKAIERVAALPNIVFPVLPWCPFPLEYNQIKCRTAPTSPGTLPLITWYPAVKKDFRVRLYIFPQTGGGYLRVDRRSCGYEYCDGGAPVFALTKLNQNGTAQVIDFTLSNAIPDNYYFRGEGFMTANYSGVKIDMGVGVDKMNFFFQ